jgi:carbon monoxide dehydrogenase subunit G
LAAVEWTQVVAAPVGEVFAFVNDPKRQQEFVNTVAGLEVTPGGPDHVGESWTVTYSLAGIRLKAKETIVERVENQRVVWKVTGSLVKGDEVQTFEALEGNATRVTIRMDWRMKGLGRLLGWLVMPGIEKNFYRSAENMKRVCEANR